MEFKHYSVLLNECLDGLNINPNGIYVDGTAGGAGHSVHIAEKLDGGKLFALDRDPDAVKTAIERLAPFKNAQVIMTNFSDMRSILKQENVDSVDGILLDLGVSSFQLDNPERGFSYRNDGQLDMRMSKTGLSAFDVVNDYSVHDLIKIFLGYGEEKYAKSIAFNIKKERDIEPIKTTNQLAEIIKKSMPAAARRDKNPCKRTFQAIRIEVNGEMDSLRQGITEAFEMLGEGGRLVVITFHSLEDRIVKKEFKRFCTGCVCPPDFPICVCGQTPKAKQITKKPILPSDEEIEENSRSKSAKLRILEKISD